MICFNNCILSLFFVLGVWSHLYRIQHLSLFLSLLWPFQVSWGLQSNNIRTNNAYVACIFIFKPLDIFRELHTQYIFLVMATTSVCYFVVLVMVCSFELHSNATELLDLENESALTDMFDGKHGPMTMRCNLDLFRVPVWGTTQQTEALETQSRHSSTQWLTWQYTLYLPNKSLSWFCKMCVWFSV